jgi:hypothetical protein
MYAHQFNSFNFSKYLIIPANGDSDDLSSSIF